MSGLGASGNAAPGGASASVSGAGGVSSGGASIAVARAPGRWRQARIASAPRTNVALMIEATAIPLNVQLFVRSGSSRKRVVPYQTKKSRTMSPGRRERTRRAMRSRTIAPSAPEIDS